MPHRGMYIGHKKCVNCQGDHPAVAIRICPVGIAMRAGARSAYKARPLAFKEKVVTTTMALVTGLTTAAETATTTATTTAEEIPAIAASLAITPGEIAITTEKEEEEDNTANVDMRILEHKEEIEEE